MMIYKYTIAVDPSINNCGYAVFDKKKLIEYDILHTKKSLDYLSKAREMANSIERLINSYNSFDNVQLVTEVPQHFGSGEKGFLSRESGDMLKLTFVCGMIYGLTPVTIAYTPNQWKQQLPKCVVRNRLSKIAIYKSVPWFKKKKKYCESCKKEHYENDLDHNIVDAIGIGHKHLFGRV